MLLQFFVRYLEVTHQARASQPIFLLLVCFGTALIKGSPDEIANEEDTCTTVACITMVAPHGIKCIRIGFALIFCRPILFKSWRVNRLFQHFGNCVKVTITYDGILNVMTRLLRLFFADGQFAYIHQTDTAMGQDGSERSIGVKVRNRPINELMNKLLRINQV